MPPKPNWAVEVYNTEKAPFSIFRTKKPLFNDSLALALAGVFGRGMGVAIGDRQFFELCGFPGPYFGGFIQQDILQGRIPFYIVGLLERNLKQGDLVAREAVRPTYTPLG